jgi:hypothetical protein
MKLLEDKNSFTVDPLVLSVAMKREKNSKYILSLAHELVTSADVELANNIRSYFVKKFTWESLKDPAKITSYKSAALRLLNLNTWELTGQECGLFVKLPWFYDEDLTYSLLSDKFRSAKLEGIPTALEKTFTLECTSTVWRGRLKQQIFWLVSDDKLYALYSSYDNPFNQCFELAVKQPLTLNFNYTIERQEAFCYNKITKFTIKKD